MPDGYLIRAQELLDLVDDAEQPVQRWVAAHPEAVISVTVIGVAMALAQIELVADAGERLEWHRRLSEALALNQARVGAPLPFDEVAAGVWQWMLSVGTLKDAPRTALQEYALAKTFGLTVLELPQPWHAALGALQLNVEVLR